MKEDLKEKKFDTKVLIIDDEPDILTFCRRALEPVVTMVETVEDAAAGLTHLAS